MRCLKRNTRSFYFCNPDGAAIDVLDERGHRTGERIQPYTSPTLCSANVSPATGIYRTEEFGSVENYDKVILTDDLNCQINENSVLFVDKAPARTAATTYQVVVIGGRESITQVSYNVPVPDYVVWRVSKSLNHVAIAIKKAPVGNFGSEEPYPK